MAKLHLTNKSCAAAQWHGSTPTAACVYTDDELRGLGLRVYPPSPDFPRGRRVFILRYRHEGRQRMVALGEFPGISVDEARRLAREAMGELARGLDPLAPAPRLPTVAELVAVYDSRHLSRLSSAANARGLLVNFVLPAIGHMRADAVTREDIEALRDQIAARGAKGAPAPYAARAAVVLLGQLWRRAVEWGLLPPSSTSPTRGVQCQATTERDRWVRPHELPRLFDAVDSESSPLVRAAVYLLLATGKRLREITEARWCAVDLEARVLRVELNKTRRPESVALTDRACGLFRSVQEWGAGPESPVFPAAGGGVFMALHLPWARISSRSGLSDVHIHDLRHTVATYLVETGADPFTVAGCLNHRLPGMTAIYVGDSEARRREALTRAGDRIWSLAGRQ